MNAGRADYDRLVELHKLAAATGEGLACELYSNAKLPDECSDFTGKRHKRRERTTMFIAMNRFRIRKGHENAFEDVWRNRDSRLMEVPGFVNFHLLRGDFDEEAGTTLYASHTIWASREAFVDWTKSEHFREAHKNAGDNRGTYEGHPQFEGFEAVLGE